MIWKHFSLQMFQFTMKYYCFIFIQIISFENVQRTIRHIQFSTHPQEKLIHYRAETKMGKALAANTMPQYNLTVCQGDVLCWSATMRRHFWWRIQRTNTHTDKRAYIDSYTTPTHTFTVIYNMNECTEASEWCTTNVHKLAASRQQSSAKHAYTDNRACTMKGSNAIAARTPFKLY